MTATATGSIAPIALKQDDGEALWFLGMLATIKASHETTGGRVAVIEHRGPQGAGSPLHVHRNEDEWFYVIEGELTFWVGGRVIEAPAGSFVYGPRGVPHTFLVASPEARFLLVTEPAGFEELHARRWPSRRRPSRCRRRRRAAARLVTCSRRPPSTGSRSSGRQASPPEATRPARGGGRRSARAAPTAARPPAAGAV